MLNLKESIFFPNQISRRRFLRMFGLIILVGILCLTIKENFYLRPESLVNALLSGLIIFGIIYMQLPLLEKFMIRKSERSFLEFSKLVEDSTYTPIPVRIKEPNFVQKIEYWLNGRLNRTTIDQIGKKRTVEYNGSFKNEFEGLLFEVKVKPFFFSYTEYIVLPAETYKKKYPLKSA